MPLPTAVVDALRRHRQRQAVEAEAGGWTERELVFTTPGGTAVDPRNFSRMFGDLCDRAGVRRVRLHDLRHTCVTLLLQLGVPPRVVMEIVGHSTLEMTMRVYGHVRSTRSETRSGSSVTCSMRTRTDVAVSYSCQPLRTAAT